jgi:phosphoglycolate phosphatase-like HAD superfamily hydrolase
MSLTQSPRTLVVFDVDGTLIHSMALDAACYVSAFTEFMGVGDINTDWSTYKNMTDPGVAIELFESRVGRAPTHSELRAFHDIFVRRIKSATEGNIGAVRETPGASGLLRQLRDDDRFSVAIATGAWLTPVNIRLEAAGVDLAGFPLASGDDAIDRATIVSLAVKRTHASLGSVVIVGDGAWDVITARALGFGFLGIGADGDAARLRSAGACIVVEDFSNQDAIVDLLLKSEVPT